MTVLVGILAAGASTRMRGADKLLERIDGEPLLARQVRIARAIGEPVVVAVPADAGLRVRLVQRAGARPLPVADAARGMSASIAALAREAERTGADALLLVLGDMPEIEVEDLGALLAEAARHPSAIVRAGTKDGRPGHPVVFPRRCFADLARLSGDVGAREVIAAEREIRVVPLPAERAVVDLDTPEAWAAWRSSRGDG